MACAGRVDALDPSTIHGNPKRGIGMLHNELYIGRHGLEPPAVHEGSGHRQACARLNPPSEWVMKGVPELRIIDDELWQAVQSDTRAFSGSGRRAEGVGA